MKFNDTMVRSSYSSPLGLITIAASKHGLIGLWFEGQRHLPAELTGVPVWVDTPDHPVLRQASEQLDAYFASQRQAFDLPLDLRYGTVFQQAVWETLQQIPSGKTVSYGEVSRRIGKPAAVRAVGAAIGRNPISVIVPCHRVIGGKGLLTGYAGGLDRKAALLKLEGMHQEGML